MGRVNIPILTSEKRKELEKGLKECISHSFRMRCQSVLLKSEGRTSKEVDSITGMSHVSVNSWLTRYKFGRDIGIGHQARSWSQVSSPLGRGQSEYPGGHKIQSATDAHSQGRMGSEERQKCQ
jgi:hypothetical protein